MKSSIFNFQFSNKGISIYLALIIMTLLLALSLGISVILFGQMRMMGGIENSVIAFYAADSGIEMILYQLPQLLPEYSGQLENGASYQVKIYASSSLECINSGALYYCIKSKGIYKETQRAIQIAI